MSNTETLKDDCTLEAVSNQDKTIPTEAALDPSSEYINQDGAEQEAAGTEISDFKDSEALQTQTQQTNRMKTEPTCVSIERVGHIKPITNESVQMRGLQVDKTEDMKLTRTRYEQIVRQPRYLREYN